MDFTPDPDLDALFAGGAEELVLMAREQYGLQLDYTDASVESVEALADLCYRTRPDEPSDEASFERTLAAISNDLGGYVGEVFRRNHAVLADWSCAQPASKRARGQPLALLPDDCRCRTRRRHVK
jgi:hypothetical protein